MALLPEQGRLASGLEQLTPVLCHSPLGRVQDWDWARQKARRRGLFPHLLLFRESLNLLWPYNKTGVPKILYMEDRLMDRTSHWRLHNKRLAEAKCTSREN